MKGRKLIMFLLLALLVAYILEVERRVVRSYPEIVEKIKGKVEPHLITLK